MQKPSTWESLNSRENPPQIRKLVVASPKGARDMRSWSGIPLHIALALENVGVETIRGVDVSIDEPFSYRWLRSAYWRLGLGWFLSDVEPHVLKQHAAALQAALDRGAVDAVVSVLPDPLVALHTALPTAMVHDCTFGLLLDYYQQFTRLSKRSVRLGHEAYRQALDHASVVIYSSQWAAQSAVRDYGADPSKVHVLEFGPNLSDPPSREEVAAFVQSRAANGFHRFLFLGVEWQRKGGDDAVALVKVLRSMGISAFLDIVGCRMKGNAEDRDFCVEHGYLDKRRSEDREKLNNLFSNASFLLVPSVAECFGCVYCEANAYGVPSIGRDTGGVSQAIKPGVNGFLLPARNQNVADLAEQVRPYLEDPDKYRLLAASSRSEFEQRLNWNRFAEQTLHLLEVAKAQKGHACSHLK